MVTPVRPDPKTDLCGFDLDPVPVDFVPGSHKNRVRQQPRHQTELELGLTAAIPATLLTWGLCYEVGLEER